MWIVDLKRRVLEAHRRPEAGAYAESLVFQPDEIVSLTLAPDIEIELARVFD